MLPHQQSNSITNPTILFFNIPGLSHFSAKIQARWGVSRGAAQRSPRVADRANLVRAGDKNKEEGSHIVAKLLHPFKSVFSIERFT